MKSFVSGVTTNALNKWAKENPAVSKKIGDYVKNMAKIRINSAKEKKQTGLSECCEEGWSLLEQEPERFIPLSPLAPQQVTPWYGEFAQACCQGVQRQELLQLLEGSGFLARFYDALACDDLLRESWRQFETEKVRAYFLTLVPAAVAVEFCDFTAQKEEALNVFG